MPDALPTDELLAFLGNPASYPHQPEKVDIVQTHASYVALAPPLVYKVKKPVDLGFLDFSTLEKRQLFCGREVVLNRRLCPSIYDGVVTITRQDDGLAWQGDGEAVEYAVRMQMLDEQGFLHQRLERGELTEDDLLPVVRHLAGFYQQQDPSPRVAEAGRTAALRRNTDENFEQTARYVGELVSRPAYGAIRYYTDGFYHQHGGLLNRRRAGGRIVDGHGDLHLEHVHLCGDGVCIYDCIEFNERFRHLDVANDVAFLAMDLDFRERPDLARFFVDAMTQALDDVRLPLLVDFYKCYRAYVRAKVDGIRSDEEEVPEARRRESRERARRYYQLALRYAVAGSGPAVVVVMGRVGTGKSAQAQALHEALGWPVVASDAVRKEQAGVPLHERGDEVTRERLYSRAATERVYDALVDEAVDHVCSDRGIVLDATFSRRTHRDRLRERLHEADRHAFFVEVTAPEEVLRERLRRREEKRDVLSDARVEDFEMLNANYEAPDALEDAYHFTIDTEQDPETTTEAILKHLIRLAS